MNSTTITFDPLPHVVGGLSEKLDRIVHTANTIELYGESRRKIKRSSNK